MTGAVPILAAPVVNVARDVIGEGPGWDAAGNRLIWSDNERGIIHLGVLEPDGSVREARRIDLARPIAGAVPRGSGGLVIAAGIEILLLDEDGATRPFAEIGADGDRVRINEIKCDSRGRLWAGTLSHDLSSHGAGLYRIDPDTSVHQVLDRVSLSNGMDWSPDARTFYYIDSLTLNVDAFDFHEADGTIGGRRTLLSIAPGEGAPDGMCVDEDGDLWIAVVGSGTVRRYSPAGEHLSSIAIATPGATSCAFGGPRLDRLFITSLGRRMPDVALSIGITPAMMLNDGPGGGALYALRVDASGRAATPFAG